MALWDKYKNTDEARVAVPKNVLDLTEIKSISEDGIFSCGTGNIYTKTYKMDDINYSLLSQDAKINILERWCRFLNSRNNPVKLTIIKNHRDRKQFEKEACFPFYADGLNPLRQLFNEEIEGSVTGNLMERNIYLTMRTDDSDDFNAAAAQFNIMEESITEQITGLGSNIHPLSAEERLKILHDFYREPEEHFSFNYREAATSGYDYLSGILPGEINLEDEKCMEFSYEGKKKYVSCLYMQDFKTSLPENFLTSILSLDIELAVSIDITPISADDVNTFLNRKYSNLRSLIKNQNRHNVNNLDWSSEITKTVADDYENIKGHIDDTRYHKQRYFFITVNFAVTAPDKEKLSKDCEMLLLTIKNTSHDAKADFSYLKQWEALNTVLPIGVKNVNYGRNVQTKALAPFNPFTMKELYDTEGIWFGKNRKSGDVIMLDRRKLLSPHGWIFGETGSGKTACAALSAMEIFLKYDNADIIIIDPKNHFKEFSDKTGGIYYDISPSSDIRINPFAFFDTGNRSDMAGDKQGILLAIAEVCKKAPITAKERTVLGRAITKAYALNRKEVSLTDIYECLKEVGNDETADDLRIYLEYFITGSLSIFSKEGNIDINNRVTVYGLMHMGEALRELSMLVIMESIKERVYSNFAKGRATWIIIDEAPQILTTPAEQTYVNSAWMLYRSLGGILTGIAQSVTQLTRTNVTKELIENSEFLMIMKQKDAASSELEEYIGLSPSELDYVFAESCQATGLIKYGTTTVPFDMRISKETPIYEMINTSFHELHKEE